MNPHETLALIVAVTQILTLVAVIIYVWKTWDLARSSRLLAEKTTEMSSAAEKSARAALKSAEAADSMLAEMKESRDLLVAPHVMVYFDNEYENFGRVFLVVRNVGQGVAYDVQFKFTPALVNYEGSKIAEIFMLREGIPSLPPGYEIRHSFDRVATYFDEHGNYREGSPPKCYDVEVSCVGGLLKERRTLHQRLDLEIFIGTHVVKVTRIRKDTV